MIQKQRQHGARDQTRLTQGTTGGFLTVVPSTTACEKWVVMQKVLIIFMQYNLCETKNVVDIATTFVKM